MYICSVYICTYICVHVRIATCKCARCKYASVHEYVETWSCYSYRAFKLHPELVGCLLRLASLSWKSLFCLLRAGITGSLHGHLAFVWVLGIQNMLFTLTRQGLYALSHFLLLITFKLKWNIHIAYDQCLLGSFALRGKNQKQRRSIPAITLRWKQPGSTQAIVTGKVQHCNFCFWPEQDSGGLPHQFRRLEKLRRHYRTIGFRLGLESIQAESWEKKNEREGVSTASCLLRSRL